MAVCTVDGPCGNTTAHDLTDTIQAALDGCLARHPGTRSARVELQNPRPQVGVCVFRIMRSITLVNDTTLVIGRNVTLNGELLTSTSATLGSLSIFQQPKALFDQALRALDPGL